MLHRLWRTVLDGNTIARANYSFHSVHMHCEDRELEGQCPTCQNPNDVFSVADWEYFRRHRPEDMIVTGFGRHRYDTDDCYILLTFDPEKREMYWSTLFAIKSAKHEHQKLLHSLTPRKRELGPRIYSLLFKTRNLVTIP
jgi:hypothetical protein